MLSEERDFLREFRVNLARFYKTHGEKWKEYGDKSSVSLSYLLLFIKQNNTSKEGREEEEEGGLQTGLHLDLMTDRSAYSHMRAHTQTHTLQRCCLGKGFVNKI